MTSLRKDAFELLEKMPEDKLTFIIQIMQGLDGLYKNDKDEREQAFERLESMRRKADRMQCEDPFRQIISYQETWEILQIVRFRTFHQMNSVLSISVRYNIYVSEKRGLT